MGFFVNFKGSFECVRCRMTSDINFQTKLLRSEADNWSREYRVGDSEVVDGLEDYCPLDPWDGCLPLVVAVGDWDCDHCGLNCQWAKVVLTVAQTGAGLVGTIRELSGLEPRQSADLAGVHFIDPYLAELSGLWASQPHYNWHEGLARWQECSVKERCEQVAAGFRLWCREVAGIDSPD